MSVPDAPMDAAPCTQRVPLNTPYEPTTRRPIVPLVGQARPC